VFLVATLRRHDMNPNVEHTPPVQTRLAYEQAGAVPKCVSVTEVSGPTADRFGSSHSMSADNQRQRADHAEVGLAQAAQFKRPAMAADVAGC